MSFRPCVLIPTYDDPAAIRAVVERVRAHLTEVEKVSGLIFRLGRYRGAVRELEAGS